MLPTDKKNLFEMVQAQANLVGDGIDAWRLADYQRAVELLTLGLDGDKDNWQARYHLALSYKSTGQVHTAANHFRYLKSQCSDKAIQEAARAELAGMQEALKKSTKLNPTIGARAVIQPESAIKSQKIQENP